MARTETATATVDPATWWSEASTRATAHAQEWFQTLQQAQRSWLAPWSGDPAGAVQDVGDHLRTLDVLGWHSAYVAEEGARLAELGSQVLAGWLDAQSQATRLWESNVAIWLAAGVDGAPSSAALSWRAFGVPLCAPTRPGSWQGLQDAWAEAGRVWLDAIVHDLQPAGEASAADEVVEAAPAPPARRRSRR